MISVAITVRNARRTLPVQLESLAAQVFEDPWELVISDGGSDDGTIEFLQEWIGNCELNTRLVDVGRPGIAAGRNVAVANTTGESIVFCDADDMVAPGWLRSMAEGFENSRLVIGQVHLITGEPDSDAVESAHQAGWGGSIVSPEKPSLGFFPSGLTANLGFSRSLFDELGGFDETFDTGEDIDFVWRARELGETPMYCTGAIVLKRVRSTPIERFSQHLRFGRSAPQLYVRHRQYGMPSSGRSSLKAWLWLLLKTPGALVGKERTEWAAVFGHRIGRLIGSIQHRTPYF